MNQVAETSAIKSPRSNVIDLLRGHYLVAILISHFHKFPSPFVWYFGKGDLWVSSADGFVFMSSFLVGLMSRRKMDKEGLRPASIRVIKRGLQLYLANIIFTLAYSLIGLYIGDWQYLNQGLKYRDLWSMLFNAATFRYSYGWADLLHYYSIMMVFISPVVLWFFYKKKEKLILAISALVWATVYLLPGTQNIMQSYLPVESWQFMFVIGMYVGFYKERFVSLYRNFFYYTKSKAFILGLFAIGVATVALSVADRIHHKFDVPQIQSLINFAFNKSDLAPGRIILFFIWFLCIYYIFQRFEKTITKYLGWLFLTYGKNSLLTYSVQAIFLFAQYYLSFTFTYFWNTVNTIALILLVYVTVKLLLALKAVYLRWRNTSISVVSTA